MSRVVGLGLPALCILVQSRNVRQILFRHLQRLPHSAECHTSWLPPENSNPGVYAIARLMALLDDVRALGVVDEGVPVKAALINTW